MWGTGVQMMTLPKTCWTSVRIENTHIQTHIFFSSAKSDDGYLELASSHSQSVCQVFLSALAAVMEAGAAIPRAHRATLINAQWRGHNTACALTRDNYLNKSKEKNKKKM